MNQNHSRRPIHALSLIAVAATVGACAFPNDGSRDPVRNFDASSDRSAPDAIAMDSAPDAIAMDSAPDAIATDGASDDSAVSSDGSDDSDSNVVTCPSDAGPSFQVCGGACVDTARSTTHCGRCDNPCGLGTECVAGMCNQRCSAGTVRCGTDCIDPRSNPSFCNADATCTMFTRCLAGQSCVGGACRANCTAGSIFCGGRCVDPSTDPGFCGASGDCTAANAGATCMGAQVCSGGVCQAMCPAGTIDCSGSCIDPRSNRMHCGASGTCSGANSGVACLAGEVCVNGRCSAGGCATGTIRCGDSCIDPTSNRSFCGARGDCTGANAGTACGTNEQCISSACFYIPPPRSILASAVDDELINNADPVALQIAAPIAGTVYYTLDGSVPSPGSVNTRSAVGRTVALSALGIVAGAPGCTTVSWYFDYGAPFGREPAPHTRRICFNQNRRVTSLAENQTVNPFDVASIEDVTLVVGAAAQGPIAVVSPGTSVELRFRLHLYTPNGVGNRQSLIFFEGPTRQQVLCHWVNDVRHEIAPPLMTNRIIAPAVPGRYAIRWNQAPGANCTVPNPLALRTIAELIVR